MAQPLTVVSRAAALRHAAVRAAGSPSALNTQPWRLHIRDEALWIYLDRSRQLTTMDPQRRILTVSVGSALFGARAALAADGFGAAVYRFPLPADPDLAAIVEIDDLTPADADLAALGGIAAGRPYRIDVVEVPGLPSQLCERVAQGVAADGVRLRLIDEVERPVVAELSRHANEIERLDPSYLAELSAWTLAGPQHRDRVAGPGQCLGLVCSDDDREASWLRAGEAMRRALLQFASAGYVVCPSTQVIEVPSARAQLRNALGLPDHPHVLLRAGVADTNDHRRRRLVDVLLDES